MLVAIPSVTKYIEKSRKKAFVTSVKNLVGVVRYGVVSEDSKYKMDNETEKGKLEDIKGYVKVIKTSEGYEYKVYIEGSTIEKNNYCTEEIDIKDLESTLTKCPVSTSNSNHTYAIGDTIEFAGSNWRVIKDSTSEEDYVTLMKERVLTNSELGNYAFNRSDDVMEYTWADNCHNKNHGYAKFNYKCNNTNSYATSKVKEMLEGTYINTLGTNNLKEVDGYKIRLITVDELVSNLGCTSSSCSSSPYASWVHQNFGDQSKKVYTYWTMTPVPDYSSRVWFVYAAGRLGDDYVNYDRGVRPVINLLKAHIQ